MEEIDRKSSDKVEETTWLDSAPEHQSFSHHPDIHANIVFEKGPPLHACFDFYLRRNAHDHIKKP